ncbi:DUF2807 domain-containing protein [Ralstonia pseudosolanacearum]|uniref:GIN domain-containing protein n=1 Tax=Ralstonia pseudosolanacearum TaxID=1310165 RepID=UPI0020061F39|nr:DUF2807 domain-containing protein [Ralstonia pseudosolanacearum]MCK4140475.1 DUF2807 domain-containing protein [Ralstonia pseudosolanacearum]
MKKMKNLVLSGQSIVIDGSGMTLRGNGRCATEVRDIDGSFEVVTVRGAFHVHVVPADVAQAVVTGDENLLRLVDLEVVDGVLTVGVAQNVAYSSAHLLHVRLQVPQVAAVCLVGAGSVTVMDVQRDGFAIEISGAGTVTAAGRVDTVLLRLPGSGSIDTAALRAAHADIELKGVGDVDTCASTSAKVRLSGVGNVRVLGQPAELDVECGPAGAVTFPER